jgi:hypothetical protein
MIPETSSQFWRPPPRAFWILFGLYVIVTLAYNFIFPPFEPTDEPGHYRYVRYLIDERRFPVAQVEDPSQFHQPPLYHTLASLITWPFPHSDWADYSGLLNPYRGFHYWEPGLDNKNLYVHGPWDAWPFQNTSLSVHVARLTSLLLGVFTVLITYQAAQALLEEHLALAATGVVAFNPMFLAISGSLQNDAGATLGGAIFLWLVFHYYRTGFTPRRVVALGLCVGLGTLMKFNVFLLLLPTALIMAIRVWSQYHSLKLYLGYLALMLGTVLISGGWWNVRNFLLYRDPSAVREILQAHGSRTVVQGIAVWGQSLPYVWSSFWGRFGHTDVVLPNWIYNSLMVLCLLALIGLALRFLKREAPGRMALMFLGVIGLTEFVALLGYLTVNPNGYMGRLTYPALPAYMILFTCGLVRLAPSRARPWVSLTIVAGMFSFAVFAFFAYLVPVYSPPQRLTQLPAEAKVLDATLGDVAVIKGYEVSAEEARPGDRVYVTLYWEPLNRTPLPYSVYIHLFDSDETLVTQRDTYPGLGRNATNAWTPGWMFADRYLVVIPETTFSPTTARWEVGLWQTDTGDRAFVLGPDGEPVASGVSFGQLAIKALPGSMPNPLNLNFGNELRLKGYSLPTRTLTPGQPFDLKVYWEPAATLSHDYSLFVLVVGADGHVWANNSFGIGDAPTAQTVQSTLAADTPPGIYTLVLGVFYDPGTGPVRVKLMADDGHEIDDQVQLTGVRVVAP